MPKKSNFITDSEVPDGHFFDTFGNGVNRKISKANLFSQIKKQAQTYYYDSEDDLKAANLEADPDNPIYVRVAPAWRLYRITSLAPVAPYDIALNNGATATLDRLENLQFINVQDMKDAPYLKEGDFVEFVGYSTPGDGGGNKCEIGTGFGTADNGSVFDLSGSGLQAKGLFPGGVANVSQFGAPTDGITDATANIQAMNAAFGYVRFTSGNYLVSTATLDAPVFFEPYSYITVDTGETYTITDVVEAPRQWIFRGIGVVSLAHDSDSGEPARMAHASWFGAFPSSSPGADQAPFIQRALDALGNTREGRLEFDIGNYHIFTAMTVPRGVEIAGTGTRRTVFRLNASGFDVFTTSNVACKFINIQFEVEAPLTLFAGKYINIQHQDAEVYSCQFHEGSQGIYVAANNSRIENIVGVYGGYPGAGSSLVQIAANTSFAVVSGVHNGTSTFGPDAMVMIGGAGSVSGVSVTNVSHVNPSKSVLLDASAGNIDRCSIDNVIYNGASGTAPDYCVDMTTSSTYNMTGITVSNVICSALASNGIRLRHSSTGTMENISVENVSIQGSSGIGVEIERTAGTMQHIRVGDTVQAISRATPISIAGSISDLRISPFAQPNANGAISWVFTLADDAAVAIALNRSVFTGFLTFSVGSSAYVVYGARAAPTPSITEVASATTITVTPGTGPLMGTTGPDASANINVDDGFIYMENRLGSSQAFHVTLLAGN